MQKIWCKKYPHYVVGKIFVGALEVGWDQEFGGISYIVDIRGLPMMDTTVTAENKLWWPLSEALYATILAFETTGENQYLEWCQKIWDYIDEHLVDKKYGGDWYGYLRKDGTIFNRCKVNSKFFLSIFRNYSKKVITNFVYFRIFFVYGKVKSTN